MVPFPDDPGRDEGIRRRGEVCEQYQRSKGGKQVTSASGHTEKGTTDWGCHENIMKPWKWRRRSLFILEFGSHRGQSILHGILC